MIERLDNSMWGESRTETRIGILQDKLNEVIDHLNAQKSCSEPNLCDICQRKMCKHTEQPNLWKLDSLLKLWIDKRLPTARKHRYII